MREAECQSLENKEARLEWYDNLCDEDLVMKPYEMGASELKSIPRYKFGFNNSHVMRKCRNMEELFVSIRAPSYRSYVDYFVYKDGCVQKIIEVVDSHESRNFRILLSDERCEYDKGQLLSLLTLFGINRKFLKKREKKELLSIIIRLECVMRLESLRICPSVMEDILESFSDCDTLSCVRWCYHKMRKKV